MVKAIDFVVRDSAGGVVRGSVAGEGSNFVQLGMGEEISLNLAQQSVAGFVQNGNDLVITLADGREIVLSGYFNETGEAEPAVPFAKWRSGRGRADRSGRRHAVRRLRPKRRLGQILDTG